MQQFRSIGSSFTTCFDWLMGGVDFTIFQDTHNPQVGVILLLLLLVGVHLTSLVTKSATLALLGGILDTNCSLVVN